MNTTTDQQGETRIAATGADYYTHCQHGVRLSRHCFDCEATA